jgi:hypothetical protein
MVSSSDSQPPRQATINQHAQAASNKTKPSKSNMHHDVRCQTNKKQRPQTSNKSQTSDKYSPL